MNLRGINNFWQPHVRPAAKVLLPCKDTVKVKAPLKISAKDDTFEMVDLEMVDPLGLVEYLFGHCGVDIPDHLVKKYWDHYRSADIRAGWAVWADATDMHIPIGLYGDSCKIRGVEKMVGIFLNFPLYRPRSIRASRFLLTCVQEELTWKRETLDCIWKHLVWACNALFDGKWPSCGPNGEPLPDHLASKAGKYIVPNKRFAVTEIRGDWLWMKQNFSFKSSWKGGARVPVCFQCEARAEGAALYYEISPDSHVWTTEYADLATFLVRQMPENPSALDQSISCDFRFIWKTCFVDRLICDYFCPLINGYHVCTYHRP